MRRGVRVCAAVALAAAIGVSGCAKKKPAPPAAPPREEPRAPTEDEIFARKTLEDLNREQLLSDAYFALDSSQITDEGRAALQKNADWLKRRASTKVLVEGHCDSRGTPEYNLALGERRATAVRDYLVNLGIDASRVTIVSKGKEAPVCTEESE